MACPPYSLTGVRMIPLLVVWEPSNNSKCEALWSLYRLNSTLSCQRTSFKRLLETNRDRRGDGDNGGFAAHGTELHKHCESMHFLFLSCTELCKNIPACLIIPSSSLPTEYGSLSSTAMIEIKFPIIQSISVIGPAFLAGEIGPYKQIGPCKQYPGREGE